MLLFALLSFHLIYSVGASSVLWSQTYGGKSLDAAYSMIETSDGGFALVGLTASFTTKSYQVWLVRTDGSGNMLWNQTYEQEVCEYPATLLETSDGGFVFAGSTYSHSGDNWYDGCLVKTDAVGNIVWNQTYNAEGPQGVRVVVETSNGGFALAGQTSSLSPNNMPWPADCWLAKTDESGNMLWNQSYGGDNTDTCNSLVETSDGGFALGGWSDGFGTFGDYWLIKTDGSGNIVWNQNYGGEHHLSPAKLVETSDGGFALANTVVQPIEDYYCWLAKTDMNGNLEWKKTYDVEGPSLLSSLIEVSDGGFILAGCDPSEAIRGSVWLVRTDVFGNILWTQNYEARRIVSLVQTLDGKFALAGGALSFLGDVEYWLARIEENGINPGFELLPILLLITAGILFVILYRKKLKQKAS